MTDAEFLATGYTGLQTGILAITAIFTLVFAYIGGLHLFLRKEPLRVRVFIYLMFIGAFLFLNLFLYSAALFGQEWLNYRKVDFESGGLEFTDFYAANSVLVLQWIWSFIAVITIVFTTLETFKTSTPKPKKITDSE